MKTLLTGGTGMLGEAIVRIAAARHPDIEIIAPTRSELRLDDTEVVRQFFEQHAFDCVIHSAAKVGGIQSNIDYPVEYLMENIAINSNVISAAADHSVPRLLFIGSSCMYPKDYRQPLKEEYILRAPLEPTNEGYALAKIVGAKQCEYLSRARGLSYRTIIPCNLFGTHDAFGTEASHLIAAIVTKVCRAIDDGTNLVEIWGAGDARREFLFVDDLADYILDVLPQIDGLPNYLNVGFGRDFSVNEYYKLVAAAAGYEGEFSHDLSRPVGMMAKLMDSQLATEFGWRPGTDMSDAIRQVISFYRNQ
jgi:GDP-L-fucose synthase